MSTEWRLDSLFAIPRLKRWFFEAAQDEFKKIPGSPVAYWVSPSTFGAKCIW